MVLGRKETCIIMSRDFIMICYVGGGGVIGFRCGHVEGKWLRGIVLVGVGVGVGELYLMLTVIMTRIHAHVQSYSCKSMNAKPLKYELCICFRFVLLLEAIVRWF